MDDLERRFQELCGAPGVRARGHDGGAASKAPPHQKLRHRGGGAAFVRHPGMRHEHDGVGRESAVAIDPGPSEGGVRNWYDSVTQREAKDAWRGWRVYGAVGGGTVGRGRTEFV